MSQHADYETLMASLPHIAAAPKDNAAIECLCFRPARNERSFPDTLTLTVEQGIPGERWITSPWLRLPDGSPDPRIQLCILSSRVAELVWHDRENMPHPGDPIIADIDTSEVNLPVGSRLKIGSALIEVTDLFNDACVKWKARYGKDALDWVNAPDHRHLRLRGLMCRIVRDGTVRKSDRLVKLD